MKAFLGTGLLGSNFVKAMRKRGEDVRVWNRTAAKAKALEEVGATAFDDAADAVKGAALVHLALKDDAAVNDVLKAAGSGLMPGAVIVDHTTTSKEGAIQRTKEWEEKGFFYQHAPVFMGPANALESSGFMLLSGDEERIARIEPELAKMTGKILRFGTEEGKAAAIKLAGNAFLICFTIGIRDTLCLAKSLGLSVADLSSLFDAWNPGAMLQTRLKRMTSGDYTNPSWELNMARKDTGLFMDAAQNAQTDLTLIPAIAALMDKWIEKGYGDNDWTVVTKDCIS
jgi:3-hydroxyisobutyrate dehydrogenase